MFRTLTTKEGDSMNTTFIPKICLLGWIPTLYLSVCLILGKKFDMPLAKTCIPNLPSKNSIFVKATVHKF